MKVCVITKLSLSESKPEFLYTISFEYHRKSIRHLGYMNGLAYARICVPVSMSEFVFL